MPDISIEQYQTFFSGDKAKEALEYAHEIRKFEIELYWKRAAYFWTFIAAAFTGYFLIQKTGDVSNLFVISSLGLVFSVGWYFVNRGSGSWQLNWEKHVDLLEDAVTGPLYKTLINRSFFGFADLTEPYPFSPSRINNILSIYVTLIWSFLLLRTAWHATGYAAFLSLLGSHNILITVPVIFVLTGFAIAFLYCKGKARPARDLDSISIHLREYHL
jgi:hypothetical protein